MDKIIKLTLTELIAEARGIPDLEDGIGVEAYDLLPRLADALENTLREIERLEGHLQKVRYLADGAAGRSCPSVSLWDLLGAIGREGLERPDAKND